MVEESGWSPNPEEDRRSVLPSPAKGTAPRRRHRILVVEDNKADVFLLREAIQVAGIPADLHVARDGEEAFEFINHTDTDENEASPSLVLLDLNLPKRTGIEVLEHIKQSPKCRESRVLIVTSSDSDQDKADTAKLGVDGYFRKPSGYDAFMKIGDVVKQLLAA